MEHLLHSPDDIHRLYPSPTHHQTSKDRPAKGNLANNSPSMATHKALSFTTDIKPNPRKWLWDNLWTPLPAGLSLPLPLFLSPFLFYWSTLSISFLLCVVVDFVSRRKRKTLNQAVHQLKSGLRSIGFITLLLTVANQPVSKICIQENMFNSFLPCLDKSPYVSGNLEAESTCTEGKVPLLSTHGTQQLQMLILMLAVFHLICSLVTLCLGEIKMKRWELWEQETETLDHKLAFDNRRFKLSKETLFGRRHLKFWSNNDVLLWIVCLLRQFTGSVSKADYFALRRGFLDKYQIQLSKVS